MQRPHPLANDADASAEEIASAESECALALGRLDGLLVGLTDPEQDLLCASLIRTTLLSALTQAGFSDAELRFDHWFLGIDRAPVQSPVTSCSAQALVQALLGELAHHPWEPLAAAARTVQLAARFSNDSPGQPEDASAHEAVNRAAELANQVGGLGASALPFASLSRLNTLLRANPLFAPIEREMRTVSLGAKEMTIEPAAPRTPLWAVDVMLGRLLSACGSWRLPLPCPGAVTTQALQPQLWPGERAILAARSLHASATKLSTLVSDARRRAGVMRQQLGHLRSSARARQAWVILAGFAPLGVGQMMAATRTSRRGTYIIIDALIKADVARREIIKGRVLLAAKEPCAARPQAPVEQEPNLAEEVLAEFDAAMADVDRLLAGSSARA